MKSSAKENLLQLKDLLTRISESVYTRTSEVLSGATIGQHVRHILECYLLLVSGSFTGVVSYDKRQRDERIENDPDFAISIVNKLLKGISTIREDERIELEADYSTDGNRENRLITSADRELAYCVEHSIHHQALIKAGLTDFGKQHLIDDHFGVDYSTLRYRKDAGVE